MSKDTKYNVVDDTIEKDDFDDFDAIISSAVENLTTSSVPDNNNGSNSTIRSLLLSEDIGFDVRDLDSDRAMRTLPLGGGVLVAAAAFDAVWDEQDNAGVVGARGGGDGRRQRQQQRLRRHHKKYTFGMPRPEWGKPPSYVGGGIGTYEEPTLSPPLSNDREERKDKERRNWSVPWPYHLNCNTAESFDNAHKENGGGGCGTGSGRNKLFTPQIPPLSQQKWFTLKMSDTYQSDDNEYRTMLSSPAQHDPNVLAMFVADHPYYAEAMLQLAMVLHYVDDRARGNELLRRTMFLYEAALPSSVLPICSGAGGYSANVTNDGFEMLIDAQRCSTDAGFLATLFRTMQLHGMSGRYECALAVGRYLLSLDPLRDPMDVLVVLDYYALASTRRQQRRISRRNILPIETTNATGNNVMIAENEVDVDVEVVDEEVECGTAFVVELVESNRITIHFADPSTDRHHWCRLRDMPNFAFSYALALYRLSTDVDGRSGGWHQECKEMERQRADDALVDALRRFPLVLPKLLVMNGVNTEDRSFRADWPSVLPHFNVDASRSVNRDVVNSAEDRVARASGEHLVGVFVKRCHGLWKGDDILWWLYQCAVKVVAQDQIRHEQLFPLVSSFSPALARYATCDSSEYEDSFRTFPPEAIALNPNIVIPAMEVVPNGRRRFLRRGGQQQQEEEELERAGGLRQLLGLGGGNGGVTAAVEVLDPDSPLLQLYMQSLFPWTQVEGVRPPAR